jgi:two-component system chemotaxis sensor kinase CheA
MSEGRVSTLSEKDVLQLIFAPGFSTASTVSDLSGRGVGLDAVQNAVHRLGGTLEAHSVLGSGSAFLLRLPISFSMTHLMVVEVGSERYGIPIDDILETCRVPAGAVQPVRAGHAFVLRDRIVPLLYLAELMRIPAAPTLSGDLKALILRVGDETIGVAVDTIAERVETLTRPLATLLQGVAGIAGTTVLGDGKVLLVLKLEELMR